MTHNIYDTPDFFREYSRLERSQHGLDGAWEWPLLRSILPELNGKRILDLGCGFGWFARWARQQGAISVLGLDVSRNMLKRAEEMTSDDAIEYRRADFEEAEFPAENFDLVFSALALHYIQNLPRIFGEVNRALCRGGWFVFSVEHPIFTASRNAKWMSHGEGKKTWPVDSYAIEGPRTTDWLAKGFTKQHRKFSTVINALIGAEFSLTQIEEWGPTADQIARRPDLAEESERPLFLLIAARK
jgi:ubiquinone/menaquinone biosynthesis C-methylase UbiE